MKKNFFKKKLASALALALVVASLSPAAASAATATKIVKQNKAEAPSVIYVDGAKVDLGLSQTFKGNKYTWTTSDADIATVSKAYGVVEAVAPGTVTLKVTARNSKGVWLKSFTHKMTVKLRSDSVEAGEDFKLVAGAEKDLNAVLTPANSTDAVRYYSDKAEVATVDEKTGLVKAVGVGEATITVLAKATWASAKDSKFNKVDTVKVTVENGIVSAKQTASNKVAVEFGAAVADLKATDFVVEINNDTHAKLAVKEVSYSTDKKTAYLTTFFNFADKAAYKVTYGGTTLDFTTTIGAPASIELTPATVEVGKETELKVVFKNADGVDISDLVTTETVSVEVVDGYYIAATNKLVILVEGKTAKVTVKLPTTKWDTTTGTALDGMTKEFTVTGVPASAASVEAPKYTVYTSGDTVDFTKTLTNVIAVNDVNKKLKIEVKKDKVDIANNFTFSSSDTSTLIINGTDLIPLKEGVVYILAKSTIDKLDYSFQIQVKAARKATTVEADKTFATVTNSTLVTKPAEFTFTVKDQYTEKMTVTGVTVDQFYAQPTGGNLAIASVTAGKVAFNNNAAGIVAGTYSVRLKVSTSNGDVYAIVSIEVKAPTGSNVSYVLDLSKTAVDTTIKADTTTLPTINVQIGVNEGGVLKQFVSASSVTVYKPDNSVLAPVIGDNSVIEAAYVTGGAINKIAAGTYKVVATYDVGTPVQTLTFTQYFTVTDSQVGPTLTNLKAVTSNKTTVNAIVDDVLEIKQGTTVYSVGNGGIVGVTTKPVVAEPIAVGTTLFIEKVTVQITSAAGPLNYDVAVGKSITVVAP